MTVSCLELTIGAEDLQVLIVDLVVAAWEHLRLNQVSGTTSPHAPNDKIGFITSPAQPLFPSAFFAIPVNTI